MFRFVWLLMQLQNVCTTGWGEWTQRRQEKELMEPVPEYPLGLTLDRGPRGQWESVQVLTGSP